MTRCRAADVEAGPADARMGAYLDGQHHPQRALAPRTALVAIEADDVVGYVAGHQTTRYDCDGELQYLYVAPAHRRRGVGAELVRHLAQWFDRHTLLRVCVNADAGAEAFYVKLGAIELKPHWYVWDDIRALLHRS